MDASGDLRIGSLADRHDRQGFDCGIEALDRYLKTQAGQDMRRKANAVFVLESLDRLDRILGYYTLCATALAPGEIPEAVRRQVPRYPSVSATLIGRLAIAKACRGQGLGGILLVDALRRAYENAGTVGSCMAIVDASDETAASFYRAHGFIALPDSPRLILPMRTIGEMIKG